MPTQGSRPTIADVARQAGVSRAAVSFAINGRSGVADETRRRILRVAEELGWQPSTRARALRKATAGAIGLVLVRHPDHVEGDDFFTQFLAGVQRTLAARDYALLLQVLAADSPRGLETYQRLITSGRIDGMLVTDVLFEDARIGLLIDSGLPAVIAGRPWARSPLPVVESRHAQGMRMLIEHLIALGHRAIGFVGGDPAHEYVATLRWAWMAAMRSNGLEPGLSASVVPEDPAARAATKRLLEASRRPTAIVYTSDLLALAGLSVASRLGLDVPADVSVAGFDDSPLAALSSPPLTTVRLDHAGFGAAAAAVLLAEIDGHPRPEALPAAPPELTIRGSTGPVAR